MNIYVPVFVLYVAGFKACFLRLATHTDIITPPRPFFPRKCDISEFRNSENFLIYMYLLSFSKFDILSNNRGWWLGHLKFTLLYLISDETSHPRCLMPAIYNVWPFYYVNYDTINTLPFKFIWMCWMYKCIFIFRCCNFTLNVIERFWPPTDIISDIIDTSDIVRIQRLLHVSTYTYFFHFKQNFIQHIRI